MGALVEASIHCSVQALVNRDESMARRVIEDVERMGDMAVSIAEAISLSKTVPLKPLIDTPGMAG